MLMNELNDYAEIFDSVTCNGDPLFISEKHICCFNIQISRNNWRSVEVVNL